MHDYRSCEIPDCEECQSLIDEGLVMACDECDFAGSQDADSWTLMQDGRTLCPVCAEKEGRS